MLTKRFSPQCSSTGGCTRVGAVQGSPDNNKNALFLINHAGKAGTERYVCALVEGALRYGYTPYFAYNESGLLSEQVGALGVKSFQVGMKSPCDLGAVRRIRDICKECSISVVHTNYLRENYIALLTKRLFIKSLRVVYTNHFVTENGSLVKAANRVMTPGNHRIISVCGIGARKLVENGNARDRVTVIHNGVDPAEWDPGAVGNGYAAARREFRGSYGIADDETVFLCASRFAHDKGHQFYVDGITRFFERGRNARFVLAGDGPLLDGIRGRAAGLEREKKVIFTGFVKDIKPLFYAADAYVNPSEHEALSFLILEALASGLPVIATDMGGNSDIVNEQNGCGILINYGDVDMLCAALDRLYEDTSYRQGLKQKAIAVIKDKFSIEEMLNKTFRAFD